MDPYYIPYNLRDALMCLGFLIGIGGGVFLLVRKQMLPGGLAIAGFVLLGIEPIAEVVIWRLLSDGTRNNALSWAYACIGAPATFLGAIALIAALIIAVRSQMASQ